MEMLAFYIPGLCFHPLHFHCLLSITVLPAFIQYLQPECLFVTTSRRYFTVYLSVITSLLKTLSRDPLLSHWRPMWFAFPFQLFVLNHLLGEPYTPPELTPAACLTLLFFVPFDFTHAVPFICHIFLQTLPLKTLLFFRVQLRFASAMKMPWWPSYTRWSLPLWPPTSHSLTRECTP